MKIISVKSFFAIYIIITLTVLSIVLMLTVLFVYNNSVDTIIENRVYEKLVRTQRKEKVFRDDAELDAFLGLLEGADTLDTNDERYKAIVK